MRTLALLPLLVVALGAAWPDLSTPPAPEAATAQDAAVVVGIGDYDKLFDVPGAADNARDWYQWLKKTRGVPAVKVVLDGDATREAILSAAEDAAARVGPGATLWFVFIGHGAPAADGQDGVLVGVDARQTPESLYARSITRDEVVQRLEAGPAGRVVVVLDACFSGQGAPGAPLLPGLQPVALSGSWQPARSTVLTAARGDQFAGPLPGLDRPAFSYLLLGSLRGWADGNRDRQVTVREAMDWTSNALFEVVHGRRQVPEVLGPGEDLVLASPQTAEPAPDLSGMAVAAEPPTASPAPVPAAAAAPPPANPLLVEMEAKRAATARSQAPPLR